MQEHHQSVAEAPVHQVQRRGDVGKCPVCGSQVDPEAYHCPKCRSEFCFHCRARVLKSDAQLQCINQDCDYYGKLICGVCDPLVETEEPPSVYAEPEDGYWPAWLVVAEGRVRVYEGTGRILLNPSPYWRYRLFTERGGNPDHPAYTTS